MTDSVLPIPDDAFVLVVDDNEQNRELVAAYLDELRCEVVTLASGQAALDAVAERVPDVIILDIMMPAMSGYQVCERLRAHEATASVPIMMLTALNESSDVERALEVGATDFLIKPVQRAELLGRVRAQIAHRRLESRVQAGIADLKSLAG
ncbi:MAG: response regulator [Planctomycetota bacterium]